MIQITTNDQYQLITLDWTSINPDSFQKNHKMIVDAAAINASFIVDISALETIDASVQMFLNDVQNEIKNVDGNLVLSQGNKTIAEQLEGMGYVCIPTLDEAVDYIFMEQIEKMMGDDAE